MSSKSTTNIALSSIRGLSQYLHYNAKVFITDIQEAVLDSYPCLRRYNVLSLIPKAAATPFQFIPVSLRDSICSLILYRGLPPGLSRMLNCHGLEVFSKYSFLSCFHNVLDQTEHNFHEPLKHQSSLII